MKKLILFALSILFILNTQAQVSGVILDSKTKEPLPFVNIGVNNSKYGTSTDIDGKFEIPYKISSLQLSYVGYEPQSVNVTSENLTIYLKQKSFNLNEVVINPEENPALRIIRNVIKNRKLNDLDRKDYTCNLYNKFSMNIFEDTTHPAYKKHFESENLVKTIKDPNNPTKEIIVPLTEEEIAKKKAEERDYITYTNSTPIMLLETYVDKKHKAPNQTKELITASKMSGFKNPSIFAMLTKMQSFSFYNQNFEINGNNFVSPISKLGIKKYFYLIEDTLYTGNDTVFVISYRPYKGKVFNGMKGVMQISTNKFGLKNVTAQPADTSLSTQVVIQQLYEEDSLRNWIPKQLLGQLSFKTFSFDETSFNGETKTYISNVDYQSRVRNREIDNLAFEIALDAHEIDSAEWANLRPIPLTAEEQFTQLDSLKDSIPIDLDKMLQGAKILMTGKIPIKSISLDLDRFFTLNRFEGFRLGAGLHTNKRLSKWFSTGGYFAYGFKDKQWKFGGDVNFLISKRRDINVNISYQNDVIASGKPSFFNTQTASSIIPNNYADMYINQMDNIKKYEAYLSFSALKHFKFHVFGNIQTRSVNNDYLFNRIQNETITVGEQLHFISEYGVSTRFAFGETFYYDGQDKFSLGTKAPIVNAKVSFGFPSRYGNISYTKYDLKIEDNITIGRIGLTSVTLQAGLVNGNVPYTLLYNPDGIYGGYYISSNNTFETMHTNEFLSNKYANFFFGHKFPNIRVSKKWRPRIELATNIGFGSLDNPTNHSNIVYKTLENGYYESGVRIHNLLNINLTTLGISSFYRYGPNTLNKTTDNVSVKMVLGFRL